MLPDVSQMPPSVFKLLFLWFLKVSSLPGGHTPFVGGRRPAVPDCVFTVLGEGRARLVHAKWWVAPLSTVKHDGFVIYLLRFVIFLRPRPPGAFWVPWVPLGASWVPPGCLLGAFWEPLGSLCLVLVPAGCLLGASIS